jgi:hypothetical protein
MSSSADDVGPAIGLDETRHSRPAPICSPRRPKPTPGFHEKDRLENRAHDRVCAGARPLRATQRLIATNWTALFSAYFG